jgi:hypothetical protein
MALFGRRQVDATVTALTWNRVIEVERREWVAKRDSWVPSDNVRNVKRHDKPSMAPVTGTPTGPDTSGIPGPAAGSTRMELRPGIYYTYETLVWHKWRSLTASGTQADDVRWPDCQLETEERISSRSESYTATFAAAGRDYPADLPEQEWRDLELGSACRVTLGLFGGVKKVS